MSQTKKMHYVGPIDPASWCGWAEWGDPNTTEDWEQVTCKRCLHHHAELQQVASR